MSDQILERFPSREMCNFCSERPTTQRYVGISSSLERGWSAAFTMNGGGVPMHTIGIALGTTVFPLVGLNLRGEVVVRKKFSRKQLLHFTANLQVELIGMEACGGSHFLGRALRQQGHEVRLMPAQYVKP
jgi:hypothetical protein